MIGKYILIGLLVGFGISAADFAYWKFYRESQLLGFKEELEERIEWMREEFYVEGLESIFDGSKDYDEGMGMNFSLREYQWESDSIIVSGVVSNDGPNIWSLIAFEFEVLNGDGALVAECSEMISELSPGDWEALIVDCPVLEAHQNDPPESMSFKVSRAFHDKTVIRSATSIVN